MNFSQLTAQLKQLLGSQEQNRIEVAQLRQTLETLQGEYGELQERYQALVATEQQQRCDYQALIGSTQTLLADRDRLQQRVAELEAVNAKLAKTLWGRRSERYLDNGQLRLWEEEATPLSEEEQAVIVAQEQADQATDEELLRAFEARRRARRQTRRNETLPEHIERRERILDLNDEEKVGLQYVGDVVTERLCVGKPDVYVDRIVRRKYAVIGDREAGIKAAAVPLAIVEGTKYDVSVYATVVAQKYAFHQPTYRQQDLLASYGVTLSRSTMNDLINAAANLIGPLFEQMAWCLKQDTIILGDDTQVRVLTRDALNDVDLELLGRRRAKKLADTNETPDNDGCVTSYAWLYSGLDDVAPYNIFYWSLTREHATVDRHLTGFYGTLVGDAFGGNARIAARNSDRIGFSACNAHARREFVEAEKDEPLLVAQALSLYRQLYDVEERSIGLSVAERQALRLRDAEPIWQRLRRWLDSIPPDRRLPKSKLAKALGYLNNHWAALRRYLSDGRLPIDNLQSERTIRPLTIGRKNWMFLGHPAAAPSRLRLFSIVSSAQRHHLMVDDYLKDVFKELAHAEQNCPSELTIGSERLLKLLPDRWAAAHPRQVRSARVQEKSQRSDQVRARRARQRIQERSKATS